MLAHERTHFRALFFVELLLLSPLLVIIYIGILDLFICIQFYQAPSHKGEGFINTIAQFEGFCQVFALPQSGMKLLSRTKTFA